MAFEEWLALGGNEVINNARVLGYARTADCPMGWFKGRPCETLAAATLAVAQYHNAAIESAPWYDPALPEISRRFYGAFGLSISGIEDSTRTATVTEGLSDGGVIGRVRKGPREVRVVAILAGEGRDALEYGMAWLNAALDPNACGQHGDACGTADLAFFSECPPKRGEVGTYTDWALTETNLITDPSMQAATGVAVEKRRNLIPNPRVYEDNSGFTPGGSAGAGMTLTPTTQGMQVDLGAAQSGVHIIDGAWTAISSGLAYLYSLEITVPPGYPAITLHLRSQAAKSDGGNEIDVTSTPVLVPSNSTVRLVSAVIGPGGGELVQTRSIITTGQGVQNGSRFFVRNVMLEAGTEPGAYFDGNASPVGDLMYEWEGTPDASPSTENGQGLARWSGTPGVTTVIQSGAHATDRDKAGRAIAVAAVPDGGTVAKSGFLNLTAEPHTWAMNVWVSPDAPPVRLKAYSGTMGDVYSPASTIKGKWERLSVSFTNPAEGKVYFDLVGVGAAPAGAEWWFDGEVLATGTYDQPPYFDGSMESDDTNRFTWTGDPDASTSNYERRQLLGVEPVPIEEYVTEVNKVRRYLHDVAAVSGPLVQSQFQSGRHWAYQVEYTLVAANPYVFGVTNRLNLPPRLPTVVADVPFNLVPYPSAELSSGTVVIARNFATNPSAEVNVDGWIGTSDDIPAPVVTRSTELASVGSASAQAESTATADSTTGAAIALSQEVPLGPFIPSKRYSINLWASALIRSGTANLDQITYEAEWRDAPGGNMLRVDTLGQKDPSGGAVSKPNLLPPDGATAVLVKARLSVPSYSTGAVVTLYADALAVTVP